MALQAKKQKFIVTGGAGFIGHHLVARLIEEGHSVTVIDNLSTGTKKNIHPKADFYKMDIQSPRVDEVFKKVKPDGVFHLAAIVRVPVSVVDPVGTTQANVVGTVNILRSAAAHKVARAVCASSSSVYGNQKTLPLHEGMTPNPRSPYAMQKLAGEHFARMAKDLYNLPVVSMRFFNVYGPGIDPTSEYSLVIGKFLMMKKQGKPFPIFGDGEQTRAFCYVDDVVEATIKAMFAKGIEGGEVINVAGSDAHSINTVADMIGGKKKYLKPRAGDVLHTKADTVLAKKLLGWQPKVPFTEGIARTKAWFEEEYA